jgi:hypothetical protein
VRRLLPKLPDKPTSSEGNVELAAAQHVTHHSVDGQSLPRIRYGSEKFKWKADDFPCHDCRAVKSSWTFLVVMWRSVPVAQARGCRAIAAWKTPKPPLSGANQLLPDYPKNPFSDLVEFLGTPSGAQQGYR